MFFWCISYITVKFHLNLFSSFCVKLEQTNNLINLHVFNISRIEILSKTALKHRNLLPNKPCPANRIEISDRICVFWVILVVTCVFDFKSEEYILFILVTNPGAEVVNGVSWHYFICVPYIRNKTWNWKKSYIYFINLRRNIVFFNYRSWGCWSVIREQNHVLLTQ